MSDFEIDVEPVGDGVSIHLPERKLGAAKRAGWLIVALAAFGTLFLIGWISTPVFWGVGLIRKGEMFGWLFVAFGSLGLGGLYGALKFLSLGLAVVRDKTRCSITVTGDKIVCREKFGWFSYKRKLDSDSVEQLYIVPFAFEGESRGSRVSDQSTKKFVESFFGADVNDFCAISNKKRKGTMMAPAYPKMVLEATAAAIAKELNRSNAGSVLIDRDPVRDVTVAAVEDSTVTVQALTEEDVDSADFSLPDDSEIEIVDDGQSKVYRIPERPLWRGSRGLFPFAVFWNGAMLVFTTSLFAMNGIDWIFLAFVSLFWLVGIGMLVGAIYTARQSALVGVKDKLLFIERKTIFGTKWTEFTADQIDSIEMSRTTMEVNNVPIMNLRIQPVAGKPATMFSHLENGELKWLAQQLRRAIGIEMADRSGKLT